MSLSRIEEIACIVTALAILAILGIILAEKAAQPEIVHPSGFCEAGDIARREESLRSYMVGGETVTEKFTHECGRGAAPTRPDKPRQEVEL